MQTSNVIRAEFITPNSSTEQISNEDLFRELGSIHRLIQESKPTATESRGNISILEASRKAKEMEKHFAEADQIMEFCNLPRGLFDALTSLSANLPKYFRLVEKPSLFYLADPETGREHLQVLIRVDGSFDQTNDQYDEFWTKYWLPNSFRGLSVIIVDEN